jgi:hypothetical protein
MGKDNDSYATRYRYGIQFLSQREAIDTEGPLGRAIIVIVSAIAELERSLIVERVRAGMRRAKLEGRQIGRSRLDVDRERVVLDRRSGLSLTQTARRHNISRASVCRLVKEARNDSGLQVPIGRLDVAMNDPLAVGGIESVSGLNCQPQQYVRLQRLSGDAVFESCAAQKLHGYKSLPVLITDVVNRADVGMIQCRCGLGFSLKAGESLWVSGNFRRQELEGNETMQPRVFSFVNHTHTTAA